MSKIIGKNIIKHEELDSTNTMAMTLAKEGAEEGTVVITKQQLHGRGKPGYTWFSKYPGSLCFTVVLRPRKNVDELSEIVLLGAKALQDILRKDYGIEAEIKLPNDVLISGKKVCGILVERARDKEGNPFVIMGIGINVNLKLADFPSELKESVTSLQLAKGKAQDFKLFYDRLVNEIDRKYVQFLSE
ncbi:MAG: biotin--[acetyl-CoA-carboxylase] ligase [Candidatus Margulisbacteria bacterium]|nr:biotin--[acetyl-CoA-carboxylase] ligase [Candidatus Margulisiibacteriota bacterium]MBU1022057.1 biotin--[acetyl-CoA-carboxylase] ligase [Candidatus Margulisiibacteriota bacterium]MBU1729652.1 biotin--[acetyl-CoA-carboxylase] ligase [Candidatus Margulisiibacteriota bacterium]MBU1954972.1 biotin--[acetyl-CoA-carboxylase] ligase [Candidatus Margulisiibacteriota bacterium]